jgi:hypothetical protein
MKIYKKWEVVLTNVVEIVVTLYIYININLKNIIE